MVTVGKFSNEKVFKTLKTKICVL